MKNCHRTMKSSGTALSNQKRIGLTVTLRADTTMSGTNTVNKMHERITRLKIRLMELEAWWKRDNIIVSTMYTYAPALQMNYDQEKLYHINLTIANTTMKKNGMLQSDSKHRFFLRK